MALTTETIRAGARAALALAVTYGLYLGVFDGLRFADRAPEVLLVLAVATGLVGGWWWGIRLGFAAGLLYDLAVATPLGLAAFAYASVAAFAGLLAEYTVRKWWLLPPLVAVGLSLYVFAGEVFGQDHLFNDRFLLTLVVVEVWAVVLAAPALRLARWVCAAPAPRRATVLGVLDAPPGR